MMIPGGKRTGIENHGKGSVSQAFVWLILLLAVFVLDACYPAPYRTVSSYQPEVASEPFPLPSSIFTRRRVRRTSSSPATTTSVTTGR